MNNNTQNWSIFSPLVTALSALVESGHWLICTSDLYLHEVSSPVSALLAVSLRLINVFPSLLASEYIIDLFPLKLHFLFEGLVYDEDVRAGFAEESEVRMSFLNQ